MSGIVKLAKALGVKLAPQDEALRVAQENAVKMLGLPPGNTPMDRARAMGFDLNNPLFRGTTADEVVADPNRGTVARAGTGVWASRNPYVGSTYAENPGGNVMPLLKRSGNDYEIDWRGNSWGQAPFPAIAKKPPEPGKTRGKRVNLDKTDEFEIAQSTNNAARAMRAAGADSLLFKNIQDIGSRIRYPDNVPEAADNMVIFKPELLRSRFAAFDPARINENNLLASRLLPFALPGLLSLPMGDNE